MPHRLSQLLHGSRVTFLALFIAATAALTLAPRMAEAAVSLPVSARNFQGTFNITGFTTQVVNGVPQLAAVGSITGTLQGANGLLQSVAIGNITVPAVVTSPTCPILHLVLGPLNLDVLGIVVTLNQVVLDITAVPGAGNLLGNLLCAVANLLNPTDLAQLVALLNQILLLL